MKNIKDTFRKALPSVVYLLLAGVFFLQTFYIKQSTTSVFGMVTPKTFPRAIILLLAICSVINLISDIRTDCEAKKTIHIPWKFLLSVVVFLFSSMFIKKLGFLIVGSVFLPALLIILDDHKLSFKRTVFLIVFGVVFAILATFAFRYGLKVRLPLYPKF